MVINTIPRRRSATPSIDQRMSAGRDDDAVRPRVIVAVRGGASRPAADCVRDVSRSLRASCGKRGGADIGRERSEDCFVFDAVPPALAGDLSAGDDRAGDVPPRLSGASRPLARSRSMPINRSSSGSTISKTISRSDSTEMTAPHFL